MKQSAFSLGRKPAIVDPGHARMTSAVEASVVAFVFKSFFVIRERGCRRSVVIIILI